MIKKIVLTGVLAGSFAFSTQAFAAEYTVQPKDTLWSVSQKTNRTVQELKELNNLSSNAIYIGQTLQIDPPPGLILYTMKSGDYLTVLAKKYGTTVQAILKENPTITDPSLVKVGQVIFIPVQQQPAKPSQTGLKGIAVHTVSPGEYLSVISRQYDVSSSLILSFNPQVTNPNLIKVGTSLNIPNEDLVLLAKIIQLEANGEPINGKIAVGNVILNRVASSQFPNTVQDVIYQPNQFTPVKNGEMDTAIPSIDSASAAVKAYNGDNLVPTALYFYATSTTSSFLLSREVVATIGNQRFAK